MKNNQYQVLMVDDEPNVLSAYRRTVGRSFELTVASSGAEGLSMMARREPFAVVISDMRMPGMNGLEFIMAARHTARETVFMMLTGNADQQTAADAINKGQIFRFLNKPCTSESLDNAIKAAIRQHELITAERVLLRDTVSGSIKLLMDALEMAAPVAFGYQSAIKRIQQEVCATLGPCVDWQVGIAASVCLIGLVAMPVSPDLPEEILVAASAVGSKLLAHIPRLQPISRMVQRQREKGMLPDDLTANDPETIEAVGAQVLRFSVDLARVERSAGSRATAVSRLLDSRRYDLRLIESVKTTESAADPSRSPVISSSNTILNIKTDQVSNGMVLGADVILSDGRLLLSNGQTITELAATSLRNFVKLGLVPPNLDIRAAA